jgi:signal transduction histidine kinase
MSPALHELTEQYSAGLREYCAKGGEALSWAFQPSLLGHRAASEGLGALEMAAMHQKALLEALLEMRAVDETTRIAQRASEFLAEALAPFEQRHRRYQEERSTLSDLNQLLEERLNATQHELEAAQDQLLEQRKAEQRKNEFICVMSHMTHGSLSVLMSGLGGELNTHGQKLLDVALRNSERVMSLVSDSPAVQTIESGDMTFNGTRTVQ